MPCWLWVPVYCFQQEFGCMLLQYVLSSLLPFKQKGGSTDTLFLRFTPMLPSRTQCLSHLRALRPSTVTVYSNEDGTAIQWATGSSDTGDER
jgi:hypothetical protein